MLKRNFAVLLVAGLVLGAGAYAWAQEGPPDPALGRAEDPPAAQDAPPFLRRHRGHLPLRRAFRGELEVWTGEETREVAFDRGSLVSSTDDRVTIEYPDGEQASFAVGEDTRVRGAGEEGALVEGAGTLVLREDGETRAVLQPRHPRDGAPGRAFD